MRWVFIILSSALARKASHAELTGRQTEASQCSNDCKEAVKPDLLEGVEDYTSVLQVSLSVGRGHGRTSAKPQKPKPSRPASAASQPVEMAGFSETLAEFGSAEDVPLQRLETSMKIFGKNLQNLQESGMLMPLGFALLGALLTAICGLYAVLATWGKASPSRRSRKCRCFMQKSRRPRFTAKAPARLPEFHPASEQYSKQQAKILSKALNGEPCKQSDKAEGKSAEAQIVETEALVKFMAALEAKRAERVLEGDATPKHTCKDGQGMVQC